MHMLLKPRPSSDTLPKPRITTTKTPRAPPERIGPRPPLEVEKPVAEFLFLTLLLGGLACDEWANDLERRLFMFLIRNQI
jgi:hypothetical protein